MKSEEKFFGTYEGSRYFTPEFYVFGLARFQYDGYLTDVLGNPLAGEETDAFLGFGPGYRILNVSDTEVGFIATSRYYYAFNDTVSFTMDTDILGSDVNTVLSNDAGVNFKMSDNLSTRISYRTDYNTDPDVGLKSTDNSIGVSLVLGF